MFLVFHRPSYYLGNSGTLVNIADRGSRTAVATATPNPAHALLFSPSVCAHHFHYLDHSKGRRSGVTDYNRHIRSSPHLLILRIILHEQESWRRVTALFGAGGQISRRTSLDADVGPDRQCPCHKRTLVLAHMVDWSVYFGLALWNGSWLCGPTTHLRYCSR